MNLNYINNGNSQAHYLNYNSSDTYKNSIPYCNNKSINNRNYLSHFDENKNIKNVNNLLPSSNYGQSYIPKHDKMRSFNYLNSPTNNNFPDNRNHQNYEIVKKTFPNKTNINNGLYDDVNNRSNHKKNNNNIYRLNQAEKIIPRSNAQLPTSHNNDYNNQINNNQDNNKQNYERPLKVNNNNSEIYDSKRNKGLLSKIDYISELR